MPAKNEFGNNKKKKKGRPPAHQNKFAFEHNPCSKRTEKILSLPNKHVCQRCSDKIEWRKKYRKYKQRTQSGTCNGCKKRNVKAAYHTICTDCTINSVKAKEVIQAAIQESPELDDGRILRACAVCVKVLALPDPDDEDDDRENISAMSRLNLRQRRAMERKIAKEVLESSLKDRDDDDHDHDDENDNDNDNGDVNEEELHQTQGTLDSLTEEDAVADIDNYPDYGDDENDPFLKAIGGADKLLTGEAYQRQLLQQQEEKQ